MSPADARIIESRAFSPSEIWSKPMSRAFTVLAECIDHRSGKRFAKGSIFDPAPTAEQAQRLVKAGCLPEEALTIGNTAKVAEKRPGKGQKATSADRDAED
ncbi:MAG: hypothetical protein J0H84_25975 [Rhizobiales bacterium]|nr:hypothetical protein [Hyphomicrobiales bacterium]